MATTIPAQRLRILDAVLSEFSRAPMDGQVALQAPFAAPRQVTETYSADADQRQQQEEHGAGQLGAAGDHRPLAADGAQRALLCLIGTQASPLRKALVDSGLGEDVTGGGFERRSAPADLWRGPQGHAVPRMHRRWRS